MEQQTALALTGALEEKSDEMILNEIVQIEDQGSHLIGERFAIIKERNPKGWYEICTDYCESIGKKAWSKNYIYRLLNYSAFIKNVLVAPGQQKTKSP